MKTETIVMCVVALLLGMLLANMLKNVCGCKTVEGQSICDVSRDYECPVGVWHMQCGGAGATESCRQESCNNNRKTMKGACATIGKTEGFEGCNNSPECEWCVKEDGSCMNFPSYGSDGPTSNCCNGLSCSGGKCV